MGSMMPGAKAFKDVLHIHRNSADKHVRSRLPWRKKEKKKKKSAFQSLVKAKAFACKSFPMPSATGQNVNEFPESETKGTTSGWGQCSNASASPNPPDGKQSDTAL